MRKLIFLIAAIVVALCGTSQTPIQFIGRTDVINVKYDLSKFGLTNLKGDGSNDDATALQAAMNIGAVPDSINVFVFPKGIFLYNKEMVGRVHTTYAGYGIGVTIFKINPGTNSFTPYKDIFKFNGASEVCFTGITFTGRDYRIWTPIQFNSYPNKNKFLTVDHCEIVDMNCVQAIDFGGGATGFSHYNSDIEIAWCWIHRLYDPAHPIITANNASRDTQCLGINLEATSRNVFIHDNRIDSTSGDGIYGDCNPVSGMLTDECGNINIYNNTIQNNLMPIELNGNRFYQGVVIRDNHIRWARLSAGFLISVDGEHCEIIHNELISVTRTMIEFTSIHGRISQNYGYIRFPTDSSGGVPQNSYTKGDGTTGYYNTISFLQGYGYDNKVDNNNIFYDTTGISKLPTNALYLDVIKLIGKNTEDTFMQPRVYQGMSDYPAYWYIENNTFTNFNNKILDITNTPFREVHVTDNHFNTNCHNSTTIPIEWWGYGYFFKRNTFDFTGSQNPTAGVRMIAARMGAQGDYKTSVVNTDNDILPYLWADTTYRLNSTRKRITYAAP